MQLFKALMGDVVYLGASYYNHIVLLNIVDQFEMLHHTDGRTVFYDLYFTREVFANFPAVFTQVSEIHHDDLGLVLIAHVDEHQLYVTATTIDYADMQNQLITAQ